MLRSATADGGRKRSAGLKPSWKIDESHEAAIFSHLNKWKHGEQIDPDSGQHPLVHLAWRALAIAYQETRKVMCEKAPAISSVQDDIASALSKMTEAATIDEGTKITSYEKSLRGQRVCPSIMGGRMLD